MPPALVHPLRPHAHVPPLPPLQLEVAHTELLSSKRPLAEWRRLERQVELAAKEVKAAEQRAGEEQAAADETRTQLQALGARCVERCASAA